MAKEWAKDFYNSRAWSKTRDTYMLSKFYLCERCGEPAKIVHHKIYLTPNNISNPDISLNLNNLEALCLSCHNSQHGYFNTIDDDYEYEFDEHGNIIPRPI